MSLIAETQATIATTRAELQVLKKRITESKMREDYLRRLFEVASHNVVDAETQAGKVQKEADMLGLGPSYGGASILTLSFLF